MKLYKLLLLILCLIFIVSATAQQNADILLIREDKNCLLFSSDSGSFIFFFNKLDSLISYKKSNINIVQIGGSHIQAGVFPNTIRQNLLGYFPSLIASRGLIFPYSVAPKCNNPIDYRSYSEQNFGLIRNVYKTTDYPLGVSGIAVYSKDTVSTIKITLKDNLLKYVTNRVTIFGFSANNSIIPTIIIDTIQYFPDKIDTVLRRYTYNTNTFSDSLLIKICNYCSSNSFVITGIFLENDNYGISYHSIGVNGASSSSFLKCDYFVTDLKMLKPDLFIFGIGINDFSENSCDTDAFVNNYLTIIEQIKTVNPNCAFIFITNNDSSKKIDRNRYKTNKNGVIAQRLIYKIAQMSGGAVWDQFEIMGGIGSMEKWVAAKLGKKDRVHFTQEGYILLGNLFFNAFLDAYTNFNVNNRIIQKQAE